ncbi:FtsX-like permease family protein [Mucilaginibacter corticis]|uniref:FtsX-like permease family protein n=1 Tax=Mucilaginibacter corticis TaxID=2597670 RepID=A0A556MUT0_9SPHI|nr:FtsX-like permease family protein [Mucilaginibacter corticis]TSJ43667.1 FtsX-like permease family protein [Mucilaginibacter corticis]
MIKNYLKTTLRGFWKNKMFTLINVIGLSVGIAASLVIYLIVHFDFSFDRFHRDENRIYRVVTNFTTPGSQTCNAGICGAAIDVVKRQLTGVETAAQIFTLYQPNVSTQTTNANQAVFKAQDNVILADDSYFRLFSYHWLAGSSAGALSRPNQVVLMASQAKKYFPSLTYDQMIGRKVLYDTLITTVSGIVADIKENTDLTFHDFISFSTVETTPALKARVVVNNWNGTSPEQQLFIKLAMPTVVTRLTKQLNTAFKKTLPATSASKNDAPSFYFQPLADMHFNANYGTFGNGRTADKTTLYELLAIALFLLTLGCINFINLTTAQSVRHAKEIGIRKTMGSSRGQLMAQFMTETLLTTFAALVIAFVTAPLLLHEFAAFIPAGITANMIWQPAILAFLLLLAIAVALAAGFYPAMILSSFDPVSVLKGQSQSDSSNTRNTRLRKTLSVTQFVIAQFFIMATVLVSKQIYYALNKDLGFRKEAVLIINSPWKNRQPGLNHIFMNKLRTMPQVVQVSAGRDAPLSNDPHTASAIYRDDKKEIKVDKIAEKFGDENYINVYHIQLLAGRNLEARDTVNTVLINQKLATLLGFKNPKQAVGKSLSGFNGQPQTQIIGVMADFQQESIHAPIMPLVLFTSTNPYFNGTFHIALKPRTGDGENWKSAIAAMQDAWKQIYPDDDFDYRFFDESIAKIYTSEQNTSKLLSWATALSVLISCLGLLGLTVYTTNQRKKEIGVRKVLGASVTQVVRLLSTELVSLILISFVIATPLAWLAMNKWIQNFADRTTVSWWIFVLSGVGMLLVGLLTSAAQTVRAALINPVRSLKSE